jgi:hypothetical protein
MMEEDEKKTCRHVVWRATLPSLACSANNVPRPVPTWQLQRAHFTRRALSGHNSISILISHA